ncbi:proline iminopeptidase [Aspergillus spectabilis]
MAIQQTGYTHSDAFDTGILPVSDIHTLHYEQYGNPAGKPVLFLHGGPGGSTSKSNTKFFNPSIYRVILFDQRGAGRSTPHANLRENTSQHLVSDIEVLRKHLSVPKWHLVFGGSWGSALALLYAQTYPDNVRSLILRGVSTVRKSELDFSHGEGGASRIFPEAYDAFVNYLPEKDRERPIEAYYALLTGGDRAKQIEAAREWNRWDLSIGSLRQGPNAFAKLDDEGWVLAHARLEAHYFVNRGFLEEGQILRQENLERIGRIPTTIIQGRYDIVCAPQTAWELYKGLPGSRLFWIPDAGHAATLKLVEVCDEHAEL